MAIRLAAFDLDGTLIRGETCVQALARVIGRSDECAAFERRLDMRDVAGISAFRETLAEWCRPYSSEELVAGLTDLTLAPGAVEAFELLRENGVSTAIVSITWSDAVDWFAALLGADHAVGTRMTESGIEHFWPADKGRWLSTLLAQRGFDSSQAAAIGDSDGDRELLAAAGTRFFVGTGDVPSGLGDVVHLPDADLADIARRLVIT